jgi:predicted transposase YdaD
MEQGIEKGREDVARNLLKKGWSVEETIEAAELPVERVRLL